MCYLCWVRAHPDPAPSAGLHYAGFRRKFENPGLALTKALGSLLLDRGGGPGLGQKGIINFNETKIVLIGDAVAGRKFSKIYIDHTVGSKKTNSGRESYDDFRTFYFLCMERYLFIRVIMP